jgi:putative restriction endonuclease
MNGYIGHTDESWWRFQRHRPDSGEVNFWRPSGRGFAALRPGEPFFFRVKSPVGMIGGFGLFGRYDRLPVWRAWEVFGAANGVDGERALLERLSAVVKRDIDRSHRLGCIALVGCVFFADDHLLPVPESFNPQNISGSVVDLGAPEAGDLWERCLEQAPPVEEARADTGSAGARYGREQRILPRLGQGSFRLAIADVYGGACCVTGERSLPALEGAHIKPWSEGGTHDLDNGLLLRRDLHRLFDLGYLSVGRDRRLMVSERLEQDFGAGSAYPTLAGRPLATPCDPGDAPSVDALAWHAESVFLG